MEKENEHSQNSSLFNFVEDASLGYYDHLKYKLELHKTIEDIKSNVRKYMGDINKESPVILLKKLNNVSN